MIACADWIAWWASLAPPFAFALASWMSWRGGIKDRERAERLAHVAPDDPLEGMTTAERLHWHADRGDEKARRYLNSIATGDAMREEDDR